MSLSIWILSIIVFCFIGSVKGQSCDNEGDLQLIGGSGSYEGNVQICHNGEWGWVCHNSWDWQEASVVCRQLGYSTSNAVYRQHSYYGIGNGTVHLDHMYCNGNEQKLIGCSHAYPIGETHCQNNDMAGVFCPYGGGCSYGDIRLANSYTNNYGRSEGRVEVCYNNEWGTVCNNYWSSNDARVACRQLGYNDVYTYWSYAAFGSGAGNIWLNYLQCSGHESSLFNCSKSLGFHSCSHDNDVSVRCYSYDTSCTDGEYRIWSVFDNIPANEGLAQVCRGNTWYSLCQYSDCNAAKIVCKALGYSGTIAQRYNGGFYYGYYKHVDNYYYSCNNGHTSLSQCYTYWWSCGHYSDSLGIKCLEKVPNSCDNGDVRLVSGAVNSTSEGRVEYCYEGSWVPMCSMNSWTANVICKQLGFTDFSWGKIITDERFGRSNVYSRFYSLQCGSGDSHTSDCYENIWGCYSASSCSTEYGIICYVPDGCNDGDLRLINGTIEQEGRTEVCLNGVWGTICDDSWNSIDGYIFCRTLGYDGPNPTVYYYSEFGEGHGLPVWSYVHCNGWEKDIHECTKSVLPSFTCSHNYVAGVTCKQNCEDGDIRLVGSGFDNEGVVEVCLDNLWGLISLSGWTKGDAKVVCNQLGHTGGFALAMSGSNFEKPQKAILMESVLCTGTESSLAECTKTELSLSAGKALIGTIDVAAVDCIYDEPTEPPCIKDPKIDPSDKCTVNGASRLMHNGVESMTMGRFEYCLEGYWVPLCQMNGLTASVVCKQLGFNQYTWAAVSEKGDFGLGLNYSLIENITCTGSEQSLEECTIHLPSIDCLPWCPYNNIGVRCYDSGICEEGSIRLADGVIDQEGRVEVCVNGVWGTVCDDGWDKTDAHIACSKLGYSDLEPIIFHDSYFSDGVYPIVYSEMNCGGWEDKLEDCESKTYQDITCSRSNIAGLLCGYDCKNGDVRLTGGDSSSEGTVEICYNNFWGLISESGWSAADSQVVCKQLGYEIEGTIMKSGSFFGKPAKTIHLSNVQCSGDESSIHKCSKTIYSLENGKEQLVKTEVAGVICYVPNDCVSPPTIGGDCVHGDVKLTGNNANSGEGVLHYCHKGMWSTFCSLTSTEATVACRQLGFADYDVASIFNDGRFDSDSSNVSYFQNITCSTSNLPAISDCTIFDKCQSSCGHPISVKCWTSANCRDGDVRLMNGSIAQEGRVEVCHDNIWGAVCADGFNRIDGYVVCKELNLGNSEPTIYTNSYFGDGNLPIVYSNLQCQGYESSVLDCAKDLYGEFSCSSRNVAGVTCQDACRDNGVRLVGSSNVFEGTVEVCVGSIWGLIADTEWNDTDAQVACGELGFPKQGSKAVTGSMYGNPNKTVHLTNVDCSGLEDTLTDCDAVHIPFEDGRELYKVVHVAGVMCKTLDTLSSTTISPTTIRSLGVNEESTLTGPSIALMIVCVFFLFGVITAVSLCFVYLRVRRRAAKRNNPTQLSSLKDIQRNSQLDVNYKQLLEQIPADDQSDLY